MAADPRRALVRALQNACSGELAACHAYRGHAASLPPGAERERVAAIEAEEWHHRDLVAAMLAQLGERPRAARERVFAAIGRTLGLLCRLTGWFVPMYGAGRLERGNVVEYEVAARHARDAGREDLVDCLLTMAEVEWEHERYFRERIARHPLRGVFPDWNPPPPKESIRAAFAARERARELQATR